MFVINNFKMETLWNHDGAATTPLSQLASSEIQNCCILQYNSILTYTHVHNTCMLSIDFRMFLTSSSHVILHIIEMTCQMHKNNANKFSKCEPCHKHK